MNDSERRNLIAREFASRFGGSPTLWARAPGRVDLMGSHTDYNLGYVMTMTVDLDTWIALRPRHGGCVAIQSLNVPGAAEFSFDEIAHDKRASWTDYVRGMAWALQDAGYTLAGFEGLVHSSIPFGSGLSSSAAIEMAVGIAFDAVSALALGPVELALLGQRAENIFVGVNSGILDQYSSVLGEEGSALLLDCRNLTHTIAPIAPGIAVVICDTRAIRHLTGTEYGERRGQCEEGVRLLAQDYPHVVALRDVSLKMLAAHEHELPPVVARRCRFIIEENARVLALAAALREGDRAHLRRLMADSWAGARDQYEIGNEAMAAMIRAMMSAPGVISARQAGAGFGGCMVALVEEGQVDGFAGAVRGKYHAFTGIEPVTYPVRASRGAALLDDMA